MSSISDDMREVVEPDVAAHILRKLAEHIESRRARLTRFDNNVWTHKGSISIGWEEFDEQS